MFYKIYRDKDNKELEARIDIAKDIVQVSYGNTISVEFGFDTIEALYHYIQIVKLQKENNKDYIYDFYENLYE